MAKEELKVAEQEPLEAPIDSSNEKSPETNENDEEPPQLPEKHESPPPPQPPRPVSPRTRAKTDLKDAFPNIDENIITAVLIASGGQLDPAFNALLYISDPNSGVEIPTPVASNPAVNQGQSKATAANFEEDDEKLARRLQQEFEREERRRQRLRKEQRKSTERRMNQPVDDNDSPDEFEQLKETFTQGFEEARTTLNGWVAGLTKKLQDNDNNSGQKQSGPKLFGALGGSSYQRPNSKFDEDPEILSNDFHTRISMQDNEGDAPQLPKRNQANLPKQSDSFTEGSDKKWQPLSSEGANSDAFLVTDSEDEEPAAPAVPTKDSTSTLKEEGTK